ncbi:MAG: SpoIID/LytB domain-containing protein [Candidatus Omnitrophica bacterium]|nr:SpoIID/LytB domain-containing protein [Candidatus Omnitrophota bacterium]
MKKLSLFIFSIFLIFGCLAQDSREDLARLSNQEDLTQALDLCRDQIDKSKDNEFYYLNLALLYEDEGSLDQAVSLLEKAYLKHKTPPILFHLGRLSCLSGQAKKAVNFLEEYLARNPSDEKACFYSGLAYEDLGKRRDALKYYNKSLQIDPYFVLPLLRIADIYFQEGRFSLAVKTLVRVKGLDPSIKSVYKRLASSFFKIKDYLASFKESSKFLSMIPEDRQMQLVLKSSKEKLGEDFFRREREKTKKNRKEAEFNVTSFVEDEEVPEVKVCIAEDIDSFEFKATLGGVLYAKGFAVFHLDSNVLYKIAIEPGRNSLSLIDQDTRILARNLECPVFIKSKDKMFLLGVFGLTHGQGAYWSETVDNFFRGSFKIILKEGKICLVNKLNLEEYLYGVLPSEVQADWPTHALYAQAVLARTKALKGLGMYSSRGFDFYNTVAYQVYLGATKERGSTNQAVNKTRGMVIAREGDIFDVYYSSNCAGHTQETELFKGVIDAKNDLGLKFPLTALGLYNWLVDSPKVFCRQEKEQKSKFRWQRLYAKEELDEITNRSLGFGDILKLRVIKRNASGHINYLKIKAKAEEENIDSEYKIRKALDDLRSSFFRVETKYTKQGRLQYFIFWGGGFGHAKGLCQYGAKGMADKGYSYQDILKHYFPDARLKKAY